MDKANLVREFGSELSTGSGALFIGAGISFPSGVVDWRGLIEPLAASRLGLNELGDADLTQVAQFIVNANGCNRGTLIHHLRKQFAGPFQINKYHRQIVQAQVQTVWTTNYDTLLEQAFQGANFSVGVKSSDDSMSRSVPNHEIEIVKMHGSIDQSYQCDLVITAEDYEDFEVRRPATAERLRTDLLSQSFLFLGYSYRDPNIQTILAQARRLSKKATRQHFLITTKEALRKGDTPSDLERRQRLLELWAENLRRFGIEVLLLQDFSELEPLLSEVAQKSRGASIYVVGSHEERANTMAAELGRRLALRPQMVLVDGQSEGICRTVVTAFVEESIRNKRDAYKHLRTFANPYSVNAAFASDPREIPTLKEWRAPLLRSTQVFVCFDGNMGTMAELEVAIQSGCRIIPAILNSKSRVAKRLLTDDAILGGLPSGYKNKLLAGTIIAEDIAECVDRLIQ